MMHEGTPRSWASPAPERLRKISTAAAWCVVALGAAGLVGWAVDWRLETVHPWLAPMGGNSAVLFILLGGGLRTLGRDGQLYRVRRGVAVIIVAVAGVTLLEYAFGLDYGF